MRLRPALAALAVLALASPLLPSAAANTDPGTGTESLVGVKNVEYKAVGTGAKNRGSDIEFTELPVFDAEGDRVLRDGRPLTREYALAGSYVNGLQIIDISQPEQAAVAAVWDCGVVQGDVQTFEREGRTYVSTTQDVGTAVMTSSCYKDLKNKFGSKYGTNGHGVMIADITDALNPALPEKDRIKPVSFVPFSKGAHNHTVHPSGKFIYNSNSELVTNVAANEIEISDITDLADPKPLPSLDLPPVPTSLGADSHDITFNAAGTRAYSAALSQTVVINTEKPAEPRVVSTIVDPTINVVHQSDPVTLTDRTTGQKRSFLVIEDEFAGALGTGQCPNGGVHVYDITGPLEQAPVKVGYWNIDEVRDTSTTNTSTVGTGTLGRCTAHVFDLHEEAGIMTIAYYNGGVRVVDISGLVGVALGGKGVGMKQVGFRRFANSDTWAVKAPSIKLEGGKAGSFFLYGNDQKRGLDVYKYDPAKAAAATAGDVWMGAAEAAKVLGARGRIDLSGYEMTCLPGQLAEEVSPVQAALQKAHHA